MVTTKCWQHTHTHTETHTHTLWSSLNWEWVMLDTKGGQDQVKTEVMECVISSTNLCENVVIFIFKSMEWTKLSRQQLGVLVCLAVLSYCTYCFSPVTRMKCWHCTFLQTTDTLSFVCVSVRKLPYVFAYHFHITCLWADFHSGYDTGFRWQGQTCVSTFVSVTPDNKIF